MACKINNQQLKELFFNGLSYDFETYRVYRKAIDKLLTMDALDDESKVYSIWFMGLLYNQALEMDPNIVTEDLPLAISKVVKEKLFEENTNFTPLLQQLKDVINPPAELTALGQPTATRPVRFDLNLAKKRNGRFGEQGFTTDGIVNLLKHIGVNLEGVEPSVNAISAYLKENPTERQKIIDFTINEPIRVTKYPGDYYDVTDGNHRATLLYFSGVESVPAIIKDISGEAPVQYEPYVGPFGGVSPAELDAKRADVERRRQEELLTLVPDEVTDIKNAIAADNILRAINIIYQNLKNQTFLSRGKEYRVVPSDKYTYSSIIDVESGKEILRFVKGDIQRDKGHLSNDEVKTLLSNISFPKKEYFTKREKEINAKYDAELTALSFSTPAEPAPVEQPPASKVVFEIGDITVHELDGSFDVIDPAEGIIGEYISNKQAAIDLATKAHNKKTAAPPPAPAQKAPKVRTFADNLNDMLAKVSKAKDFTTAYDLLQEYLKLVNFQASLDKESKVSLIQKFAEAVGRMPEISGKSALVIHVNSAIDRLTKVAAANNTLNLGNIVGIGRDAYIIIKEDGTPIEAYFNPADRAYYEYNPEFDGTNFDALQRIDILEGDYIYPIYRVKDNLSKEDESGDWTRFQLDFLQNAVRAQGVVRNPNLDNRTGLRIISDNTPTGLSVMSQIKMTADRRPGEIFRRRLERIKADYPQIAREPNLRPYQREALMRNPNQPIVGFIHPVGALQLRISDLSGENFDILETFDQLRFIYADGRVEQIDFTNKDHVNKFKALTQVKKGKVYVTPNDADLANLSYAIERLKEMKSQINDMMGEAEVMDIPQEILREYLTISNNLTKWGFVDAKEYANPKQTLSDFAPQLTSIGSTIDARIAPKEFDKVGVGRDFRLVGVIKKTAKGFTFENVIPSNHVLLSPEGEPITIEELFERNGLNKAALQQQLNSFKKGHLFFYLYKQVSANFPQGQWLPRPMAKAAQLTTAPEMVGFLSSLSATKEYIPEYSKENAQRRRSLIQQYNNKGWGFTPYKGLIANVKFLRTYNPNSDPDDVYGIELRATSEYPDADKFNQQEIELQFSFRVYDIQKQLNVIYKALKKNPANYNSLEQRLQLAQEIQEELKANAEVLSPAVKNAIAEIESIFNKAQAQIFEQAQQVIKSHAMDVAKGEDPYLDKDTFLQILFNDPKQGKGFRLRNAFTGDNPLSIYKVFENAPGESTDKVLRIRLSDVPTITDSKRTVVTKARGVKQEAPPSTAPAPAPTSKVRRPRIQSLVSGLEGIKTLSTAEFAAEIAEAQRLLGKIAQFYGTDLSATDADGVTLGIYENQLIKLDNNIRAKGVAFHEAFHAIFRLSLTAEQRQSYYDAVKKVTGGVQQDTTGKYINSRGKKVYLDDFRARRKFYGAADEAIENLIYEEYMADGFASYKETNKQPKNALLRLFYNLLDKLIALFRGSKYKAASSVKRLYGDINAGRYADVLSSTPFEGPIAYELIYVPKYMSNDGVVTVPVDTLTYDQIKDMIVKKLAVKNATAENFDQVYDAVTKDLIDYYDVEALINENNQDRADAIRATYGPMFSEFRYMMGYAHRYKGQFKLQNRTADPANDNLVFDNDAESIDAYESLKNQVRRDYEDIAIITDVNTSDEEQAAETENGNIADEDPEYVQSNAEEEVGERFDDDGIITLKPYEGTREFQRILRYIEYDYIDEALGVSFKRMVNSRFVMNTIRKVVANSTIEDIMPRLQAHIEQLDSNIEAFYNSDLYQELGKIPLDMMKLIEEADTLRAVYNEFNDNAGVDENGLPTIASGAPMLAMFHKVFELAQVEIINQVIEQEPVILDDKTVTYENSITNERIVEKKSINDNTTAFKNRLDASYLYLSNERVEYIDRILKSEFTGYKVPDSVESFEYTVNSMYRLTSLMELNIPRNLIEFSVASNAYRVHTRNRTQDQVEFLTDIINNDIDLYEKRRYFNPYNFYKQYKVLVNAIVADKPQTAEKAMERMVRSYHPASWYQVKYDPTMVSGIVRNSEGKSITSFVPFTPSLRIAANIKRIGTRATIEKYFPEFVEWFESNPWLRDAMSETAFNPRDKSEQAMRINMMKNFMQVMSVSVAGGVRFRYGGKRLQSTFRRLGDKSYMLSMLGMFLDKEYYIDDYNNTFYTFNRPITQFESTGTQFNVTGYYQNYALKIDNKYYPTQKGGERRKLDAFLGVIGQEFDRIGTEYDSRYDKKQRFENYNAKTDKNGNVNTVDDSLRAYNFQILKDFFAYSDVTKKIENQLRDAAKQNTITFDAALDLPLEGEDKTVRQVLEQELVDYGNRAFQEFKRYLVSIDLIGNTGNPAEDFKNIPEAITIYAPPQLESDEQASADYLAKQSLRLSNQAQKEQVLEDFMYNYWFNSMYFNQLFDGDIAVGIDNLISYFKRQKSGVAAGPNRRNHKIDALNDVTRYAVIRSQTNKRQISGYINSTDPYQPASTSEMEGGEEVEISNGQAYVDINHRIKEFDAHGLVSPELMVILKKMRYAPLTYAERQKLVDGGIILNSKKPVIAHPLDYIKDSEHLIIRSDVSRLKNKNDLSKVEDLYALLDDIDLTEIGEGSIQSAFYQEIMRDIHSYYEPIPGNALLHHFLNAIEYHRVDILTDETTTKKASPAPLVIDIQGLEDNIMDPDLVMTVNDDAIPVYQDGYINLAYSTREVNNEFVYQQVRTSNMSELSTDSIQKKILNTAGITPDNPKYASIKKDIEQIRQISEEIARSRMQYLERMWGAESPSAFISKLIQQGLISQGASSNLLKFYKVNEDGKNEFNLNLPILGKTPLYYFFSLFNRNVFSPKVPGKKFIHVSSLGYKIKDQETGKYRYPTVKKQTVTIDGEQVEQTIAEVIIPRELAANSQEQKFFEELYAQFLAARIPTEGHRSMVVVKVVGYLDASYGNSIIVPPQVHKWAGSDMDIDTLFTEMAGYYRNVRGQLVKYGDYGIYKSLKISEQDAKFIEYLHFIAQDPAFEEQIEEEQRKIDADRDYKKRSLANGAARFSPEIKKFFDEAVEETKVKKQKSAVGLDALSNLVYGVKGDLSAADKKTVKLVERLIPVINVINRNQDKTSRVPSTPQELAAFTTQFGNPVTPVLQNKLIVHNMNVLANQAIFDEFVKEFSADAQIEPYKKDAGLLENLAGVSALKTANPFTAQSVAMVRALNQYAKAMVGGNANTNKAVAIMLTSKIKLANDYAFNVSYNEGKAKKLNSLDPKAGVLVGGSIGMATDDGKNQVAGVLKLDINTASIMNAMYAYGFPPQLARMIHSVGLIGESINNFRLNNDKSFAVPGQRQYSFTTYLNNEISKYFGMYEKELKARGLLLPTDTPNVFEINPAAFTIKFNDITAPVENANPDSFGIRVLDKKGKELPMELANVVLLGFYQKMNTVGNRMSFRIATITNVLKSIAPSFNNITRIQEAADFINDNKIFEKANQIWKDYPAIDTLVNQVIPRMIDTSTMVLLDKTALFSAVIEMFKNDNRVSQDEVVTELKSILAMSALNASVKEQMVKINDKIAKDQPLTTEEFITTLFDKTLKVDYWTKDSSKNTLDFLLEHAPDNLFLQSLSSEETREGSLMVVESRVGNRLSLADQEQVTDAFLQLANSDDQAISDAAIELGIAAIVKDGGISRRGGFLKIIAPGLFAPLSERLDLIQEGFREADAVGKKKIETYLKRIDKVFSDMYQTKTTGAKAMEDILAKMVSTFTVGAEPNPRLRMSFFVPPPTGAAASFTPGKFSKIPMSALKSILDNILPQNKQFVYKAGSKGRLIEANHAGLESTAGVKSKGHNFEFWKGDYNGEIFWNLSAIPQDVNESANELLKHQGIYKTRSGEYGFPLYQINNYEGGQLFIITEIDGKPFTENLFKNLYTAYTEDGEFQHLLRGKTAKYKIIPRQSIEGISPNSFTNEVATQLRATVLGARATTARRVQAEPMLPPYARLLNESHTIAVSSKQEADNIAGRTYVQDGIRIKVTSQFDRFATNANSPGAIFHNGKRVTDPVVLNQFANTMGFANWESYVADPNSSSFLYPKQGINYLFLVRYSAERVERGGEPTAPTPPAAPAQPTVTSTTGFQGYKFGFEDKGKGTVLGDGKDKAMRQVADSAIVELASNKDSSSKTSLGEVGLPKEGDKVIMLARNGSLSGKALRAETKKQIREANLDGAEFVVGDMPGVDSQFIDYLQEIGAKFTIYHTGPEGTSRIKVPTKPRLKSFFTVEKMKKGTFRDIPVRIVDFIPTTKDKEVAARTINGVIEVVPDALKRKFDQKAWIASATQKDGSKATPLAADTFTDFNQFLTFVLLHEAKHFDIKKTADETIGQYEDRINAAAMEDLKAKYIEPPTPPGDDSQDNNPFTC